nr:DUF234 domain-containing protein [Thermococcus argininiproducens]
MGRWWHRDEKNRVVALNEREKKALFVEVKWKSLSERVCEGSWRFSYPLVSASFV